MPTSQPLLDLDLLYRHQSGSILSVAKLMQKEVGVGPLSTTSFFFFVGLARREREPTQDGQKFLCQSWLDGPTSDPCLSLFCILFWLLIFVHLWLERTCSFQDMVPANHILYCSTISSLSQSTQHLSVSYKHMLSSNSTANIKYEQMGDRIYVNASLLA